MSYEDAEFKEIEETEQEKSWYEKALDWAKDHKALVIVGAVFLPITLIFLGAKMFSKTKTIEIAATPDPTIWDQYQAVPTSKEEYIKYDYIPVPPEEKVSETKPAE